VFDISIRVDRLRPPRVLEVGSGYGDLLAYLGSRGCHVQGVDLDPRAAEAGAALGVPIHTGTVETLQGERQPFDIGVLCHSLEHLPDPVATLTTIHGLLRPGAELHVAVPNGNAAGLTVQGRTWMHLSYPLHFWFFDRSTLTQLLERCGFQPSVTCSTSRWHHLGTWLARLRRGDIITATREACAIAIGSLSPSSGDVLRVTATRVP
jgi:SAM-dependent methyltransferase